MKYTIKTRNFNASKTAHRLLMLWPLGGHSYIYGQDLDIKFFLETRSIIAAWLTFAYWMAIRPLTGGWTYIIRPGHELKEGYKAIN